MNQLSIIIRQNRIYFISCFLFFVLCSLFLFSTYKTGSFLTINRLHSFSLNVFFVNYTFFGDGIFSFCLCAFLFYKKQHKLALCLVLGYLSSGLAIQLLKQVIYTPSPILYFENSQYLFPMDNFGSNGSGINGFPSGHTSAAFVLATTVAIYIKKNLWSLLFFFGAILVGYSRIYLAQHSPVDVLAAAFIGIVFATLSVALINSNIKIRFLKKFAIHPKHRDVVFNA